jgi:AhpD family alkylhydroperoxidase
VVWITASVENGCEYCVAAHSTLALRARVPAEVVEALRAAKPLPDAALEAARRLTQVMVAQRVDDAEVEAFLAAGYTRRHVLDVVLGVGMKTLSNYTNHIAHTRWIRPGRARSGPASRRRSDELTSGAGRPARTRPGARAAPRRSERQRPGPRPTESEALAAAGLPEAVVAQIKQDQIARIPLGRRGTPEVVAAWIVHLADPAATWITSHPHHRRRPGTHLKESVRPAHGAARTLAGYQGRRRPRKSRAAACARAAWGLSQKPRCEPSSIQKRSASVTCS